MICPSKCFFNTHTYTYIGLHTWRLIWFLLFYWFQLLCCLGYNPFDPLHLSKEPRRTESHRDTPDLLGCVLEAFGCRCFSDSWQTWADVSEVSFGSTKCLPNMFLFTSAEDCGFFCKHLWFWAGVETFERYSEPNPCWRLPWWCPMIADQWCRCLTIRTEVL